MRQKFKNSALITRMAFMAVIVILAFQPGLVSAQSSKLQLSGTVEVNQAQIAFIFSGNVGGGKLMYQAKVYPFSIGGLGVGGFGVSSIKATGKVYNMSRLRDFEGAFGQARTGIVVGSLSKGTLWLENTRGVYLRLDAKRKGLALSVGLDAIYIKFD